MANHYHFVVAVDFGTTYSSVTFHQRVSGAGLEDTTGKPPKLTPIGEYPGAPANKSAEIFETPTVLLYSNGQTFWGHDACNRWGQRILGDGTRIQWFKLLLDDNEGVRQEVQSIEDQLKSLGLTVDDAILEYLVLLLTHTRSQLRLYNRYCESCTVQLVLTVPNVWSARACSVMVHAVENAAKELSFGHDSEVFLVSEADAAATYFCEQIPDLFLNIGDVFMVADTGGGTSDLMVYKVIHMNPFRFDSVVPGKGAVCGSSHLNQAFVNDLKSRIEGDSRYGNPQDFIPANYTLDDILRAAHQEFENTKRHISAKQEGEFIGVPFLPKIDDDPNSAPSSFFADRTFLENIFLPRLEEILRLIRSLMQDAASIGQPCNQIILIGGFSHSEYLVDFLRSSITDCGVLRRHTSQDAISRGGCLRYLNQVFGPDEIMQASYGFLRQERLQDEEFEGHRPENVVKQYDRDDGEEYAQDCISYIVRRGQRVSAYGQTFPDQTFMLERTFRSLSKDIEIRLELYENRSENVLEDHFHRDHQRNNGLVSQGAIEFHIPASKLKLLSLPTRFWNRHQRNYYYKLQYEARIKILGKNIRYELWVGGLCRTYGVLTGFSMPVSPSNVEEQFASLTI